MAEADAAEVVVERGEPIPISWIVATLVVYVALGFVLKTWVLNWIIGPLFPLLALYVVPTALRRISGRGAAA